MTWQGQRNVTHLSGLSSSLDSSHLGSSLNDDNRTEQEEKVLEGEPQYTLAYPN